MTDLGIVELLDDRDIYNNLSHNTAHTIFCSIANCFAFDSSGNVTSVNDSEVHVCVSLNGITDFRGNNAMWSRDVHSSCVLIKRTVLAN